MQWTQAVKNQLPKARLLLLPVVVSGCVPRLQDPTIPAFYARDRCSNSHRAVVDIIVFQRIEQIFGRNAVCMIYAKSDTHVKSGSNCCQVISQPLWCSQPKPKLLVSLLLDKCLQAN